MAKQKEIRKHCKNYVRELVHETQDIDNGTDERSCLSF